MNDAGNVAVSVPASSANLGPGFDVLGLALDLYALAGVGGDLPPGARVVEAQHPAAVAFAHAGGEGPLWVRSPIPMGRGLGYSGAVRVAGAVAAMAQADPTMVGELSAERAAEVLDLTAGLEGHADNVAASIHGGVVVAAGGHVARVPCALEPSMVMWVPDDTTTSTDRSRARMPESVPFADAVFNVGRVTLLVAALASGDVNVLDTATDDRLHQPARLASVPGSAAALASGRSLGAWCGWLSGSGPTVALMCAPSDADRIARGLPDGGHTKVLAIDRVGTTVSRRAVSRPAG